ncbi:MAG: type II/IV secretion system protein [Aestuariivirga sp.]|uniref:GspE/PulE family protein n=1 Tax=Aestuariivirga sp. TaxID=2650926 RepID=UPI0025C1B73C|nr:GspE/PulE family protein [Aestuariivirga sp.]MCA3561113.1 type II/IV secretion system protein [Aestuariivirga sp.]
MKHLLSDLSKRALISDEQAARILGEAADGRDTAIRLLLRHGLVDQQVLATELGRVFDLPVARTWPSERVLPEAISLRFMRERHVLPAAAGGGRLSVIVSDPSDEATLNALRLASGLDLSLSLGTDNQILSAIERLDEGRGAAGQTGPSGRDDDDTLKDLALDAPVIDLVNRLFREASAARATDLHIEPARGYVIVRHRVDGLLEERERLGNELGRAAVSRLKILTNLNIAEKRLPQDGRARLRIAEREHDIRVATMPTIHGESIAIRFLSSNTQAPDINRLGLSPPDLAKLRQQIQHAHGMIVVTGPTGSGKTTTLAAVLGVLNDPRRKIVTIEDPVEYQVEGVNQIQIHSEIGLSFARTLRSLLRFDPDIIMVGEMRDSETASIGVNAALTGHLVLTTLHTNSAAGAVVRLLDLGVQAYLIASTLRCVVAQRLVRKLCIHCREPYEAPHELLAQLPESAGAPGYGNVTLYKACGCTYCGNTGFAGRAAIFEALVIDDHVRRLIKPGVSADVIAHAARKTGTPSMMADGFAKCREGLTTIEELGRVTSED